MEDSGSRDRDEQILQLFDAVSELPPEQRATKLDELCSDPEIQEEVERMLQAYDRLDEVLDVMGEVEGDLQGGENGPNAGDQIGRFKLQAKVGEGGMGVVYEARDTRLDRQVALKFLPPRLGRDPDAKKRFLREAQTASALDHPNAAPILEISDTEKGRPFLVMPFYEGPSLAEKLEEGSLPIEEVLDIAVQITRGLNAAHEEGIVHRDVKPANVLLPESGPVKLVDFGLAKWFDRSGITQTGSLLGTLAYLSPEHARGEEVDHRTDLWSLGVVLYRMLSGQLPFQGKYEEALLYQIVNEAPKPLDEIRPDLPDELAQLVADLLEKNPDERPSDAATVGERLEEVAKALNTPEITGEARASGGGLLQWKGLFTRWKGAALFVIAICVAGGLLVYAGAFTSIGPSWRGGGNGESARSQAGPGGETARLGPQSVAVLPFTYLAAEDTTDYFSLGMTGELITRLGQVEGLSVIGRTSVMQYEDTEKTVPQIGRELGVAHVVEGSITRAEDQIRVQWQLLDSRTGENVWSGGYTRSFENIIGLQVDLAREIAENIKGSLLPETQRQLAGGREVDPTAYRLYLQARELRFRQTGKSLVEAVRLLRRSLSIDSTFAPAWALLSTSAMLVPDFGGNLPPNLSADSLGRVAALRAMEIDSTSAEVRVAIGVMRMVMDGNFPAAGPHLQRAVELGPSLANAWREYGNYLSRMGQFDLAEPYLLKAAGLNPASPEVYRALGANRMYSGHFEQAKQYWRQGLRVATDRQAYRLRLWDAYVAQDSLDTARKRFAKAIEANPERWKFRKFRGYMYGGFEDSARAMARRLLPDVESRVLTAKISVLSYAGWTEEALALIPDLSPYKGYINLKVHPAFIPLRGHPTYKRMLREMGLEERTVQQTIEKLDPDPPALPEVPQKRVVTASAQLSPWGFYHLASGANHRTTGSETHGLRSRPTVLRPSASLLALRM